MGILILKTNIDYFGIRTVHTLLVKHYNGYLDGQSSRRDRKHSSDLGTFLVIPLALHIPIFKNKFA